MKLKRAVFIGSLIVLFIACFSVMNKRFDALARYKYANDSNRELIETYLSSDDINYLIDRQYKPEEFLPYFGLDGFNLRYVNWYNSAKNARSADLQTIVSFVNHYLDVSFNHDNLVPLLENYSYETLTDFFEGRDRYSDNTQRLMIHPDEFNVPIPDDTTLYTFTPTDLEPVEVPSVNRYDQDGFVELRKEANQALFGLCAAATEINGKTCGNLITVGGYISYENQIELYEKAVLQYGKDEAGKHVIVPGYNDFQRGLSVELILPLVDREEDEADDDAKVSVQEKWLNERADQFGFLFEKKQEADEEIFTLRYVGVENAKEMKKKGQKLEDLK